MILIENETDFDIDTKKLQKIALELTSKDIELIVCKDLRIKDLNAKFRGIDRVTDVLSFPLEDMPFAPLGSIVINIDKAKQKALRLNHTIDDEICLLFIHGLLHLLGYDHEVDYKKMRDKEKEMIEKFDLPKSLIIRNT